MARVLVTVGSDGLSDWVQTPDGQKFTLGPVSVREFVKRLSPKPAKPLLERFVQAGELVLSVDLDHMWEVLKPRRARFAVGPFMTPSQGEGRNFPMDEKYFQEIEASLSEAEKLLGGLSRQASDQNVREFLKAAQKIKSPNQSKNQTYYNLGAPDVHEVMDPAPEPHTVGKSASFGRLSFDIYQENQKLATETLAAIEETEARIAQLVSGGKKFNAGRARADLHEVVSKVAGILREVDLTQPWVHDDLTKLASRSQHLRGLFVK